MAAAPAGASVTLARVGMVPRTPAGARADGSIAASTALNLVVELTPRDSAALGMYALAVSTPGSAAFRHYLTVSEFRSLFAPTNAQINAVEAALRVQGLDPEPVSANGLSIDVTAPAAVVTRAFGTPLERIILSSGRVAYANTAPPAINASVSQLVSGVIGLSDLTAPHALGLVVAPRPPSRRPHLLHPHAIATDGPQPCAAATSAAPLQYSYTSNQIASAYNLQSLYQAGDLGAGETIALLELEPDRYSDIAQYQSCYGTSAQVNYIRVDGGQPLLGEQQGEAALDIENVIGLAPQATVDVYQAPNTDQGVIDDYTAMIENASVNVISTSWGDCEAATTQSVLNAEATLFEEAAIAGKSVFAAAGDDGSSDCGSTALAIDDPGSQPFVTSVGGLTLSSTSYPPEESVWNDSGTGTGAGGGGISSVHLMPAYQADAPASLGVIGPESSGTPCDAGTGVYCREVPDVSADADPYTGYLIYFEGQWTGIGGTSAAAPLWAAVAALTDASSACNGTPIGFANGALYAAAGTDYAANFTDITSGTNDYAPDGYTGGLYAAQPGFDLASGLGSPNGATLPAALCDATAAGGSRAGVANTVSITGPGAQTATAGTAANLQVAATDTGGASLTFIAAGLPPGLSISSSTGAISGTPTATGASAVTVTAVDPTGASAQTSFPWTVTAPETQTDPGSGGASGSGPSSGSTAGSGSGSGSGTGATAGGSGPAGGNSGAQAGGSGGPGAPGTSPAAGSPSAPDAPTPGTIRGALRSEIHPRGAKAKLPALLALDGFTFAEFRLPEAGRVTVSWFTEAGGRRILIATGSLTLPASGSGRLTLALTPGGRRELSRLRRVIVSARTVFAPPGAAAVVTTASFALGR